VGRQLDSSTYHIPTFWGNFSRFLPTDIGGVPGHGGVSADLFTPRYHVDRTLVVSTPVRGVFGSSLGRRTARRERAARHHAPSRGEGRRALSSYELEVG
jgi:hypothetical protein